jgi:transposase-like protein
MNANSFKTWIHRLEELTCRQREDLRRRLSEPQMSSGGLSPGLGIVPPTCCPHCQGQTYRSWGQSHGLPRYRCPRCSRTFNALSGTALARLRHRELWSMHAIALIEGWSLRDEAKRLNINKNTAFLWRHRFIQRIRIDCARNEPRSYPVVGQARPQYI